MNIFGLVGEVGMGKDEFEAEETAYAKLWVEGAYDFEELLEGEYLAVRKWKRGRNSGCRSCSVWPVVSTLTFVIGNWEAVK